MIDDVGRVFARFYVYCEGFYAKRMFFVIFANLIVGFVIFANSVFVNF